MAQIIEARSAIDQTKGMLMLAYGIDEAAAFEMLRAQARRTNVSLKKLARQFRHDVAQLDRDGFVPPREIWDELLRTAHERLGSDRMA